MNTDYPDALTTRITNIMNVEINLVKKSVEVGQESISVVQVIFTGGSIYNREYKHSKLHGRKADYFAS